MAETQTYDNVVYICASRGLESRYANDRLPDHTYVNVKNLEVRQENALSLRFGHTPLTVNGTTNSPLDGPVLSLGRLKSLAQTYRYAVAGGKLYRIAGDNPGVWTVIATGLSSVPHGSMVSYRPVFSSYPYIFVADQNVMLKDNGTGSATTWGGIWPEAPIYCRVDQNLGFQVQGGETFVDDTIYVYSGSATHSTITVTTATCTIKVNENNQTYVEDFTPTTGITDGCIVLAGALPTGKVLASIVINTDGGSDNLASLTGDDGDVYYLYCIGIYVDTSTVDLTSTALWTKTGGGVSFGSFPGEIDLSNPTGVSKHATVKATYGALSDVLGVTVNPGLLLPAPSPAPPVLGSGEGTVFVVVEHIDTTNSVAYLSPLAGVVGFASGYLQLTRKAVEITTSAGAGDTSVISNSFYGTWFFDTPTNSANPALEFRCKIADPTKLDHILIELSANDSTFTNKYSFQVPYTSFIPAEETVLEIPLSSFTVTGSPTYAWEINAWRITFVNGAGGSTTIDLYSMGYNAQSTMDTRTGLPYDYRCTFYDANTGYETAPSPVQLPKSPYQPTDVVNQPVTLLCLTVASTRYTHVRFYRRGGNNNSGWNLIGQVPYSPSAIISYLDGMSDSLAIEGQGLSIDPYPPITSTLPVPVNTTLVEDSPQSEPFGLAQFVPASMANISLNQRVTIGQGQSKETVTVVQVEADRFRAYSEFAHYKNEAVSADAAWMQPCSIAAVAFDRMFLAGDANNPGRLYYSNVSQPESFPPQNYIDIGDSSNPILGMAIIGGYLQVWTISGITPVLSVGGSVPVPTQMNVRHGLFSRNALIPIEGGIPYLSYDGTYMYEAGVAVEVSEDMQWVFRSYAEAGGPVPVMDLGQRDQVSFGYDKSEVFVAYMAIDAQRYRVIWSYRDKRWRWDTVSATAMNYEDDSAMLIYGDSAGMVYRDRTGNADYNTPGTATPIQFELRTASLDQGAPKNKKNYNEFTVDINTNSQPVAVALLFDNQATTVALGTVQTATRQQVQFNVNNGQGIESLNVAFLVTGEVTDNVDIFELHVKMLMESELRKSLDTYWAKYGTEEYKLVKQGYFEYKSTTDLALQCFIEGDLSAPAFTRTLPNTNGVRRILWIRFPAVKATMFRWIVTGASDFQMYQTSHIEVKPLCGEKGYAREPLRT